MNKKESNSTITINDNNISNSNLSKNDNIKSSKKEKDRLSESKLYTSSLSHIAKRKAEITCIGAANIDYKFTIHEDVVLETSNPASKVSSIGGVVRNVAENLARLGEGVSLMSKLGNDADGTRILKSASSIMHIYAIDRDDSNHTGTYTAILDNKGDLLLGLADMDICNGMNDIWIKNHEEDLADSNIIVCDTNIQKSAIQALQKKEGKKIIIIGVSVAKTSNIPENLENIYLAILNKDEAEALTRSKNFDYSEICKKLKSSGLERCVITMGKSGCVYYDEYTNPTIIKAEEVINVVDVTGAGDSFSAGVIYAIKNEKPLDIACKYGMRMAVLNLQSSESVVKEIPSEIFQNLDIVG